MIKILRIAFTVIVLIWGFGGLIWAAVYTFLHSEPDMKSIPYLIIWMIGLVVFGLPALIFSELEKDKNNN